MSANCRVGGLSFRALVHFFVGGYRCLPDCRLPDCRKSGRNNIDRENNIDSEEEITTQFFDHLCTKNNY
jgi:hypothetical protein